MAETKASARDAVLSGSVLVSGSVADKPGRMVQPSEPIALARPVRPFVSRGGEKLEGALDAFRIDVAGRRCMDVGASTGGFTDCLLKRGAASVVAVDVGRGQLEWSLRKDSRVEVMEQTDVRDLDPATLGRFELVVVDLSFISLRTVMPSLARVAGGAPVVALVKPQFEVGRARVGSGGVVRDRALHDEAVSGVIEAAESIGLRCVARVQSPLLGAEGNKEFFVHLERSA